MGVDAATHIVADSSLRGPADVAAELAAMVRDHAAAGRSYGLVLLGNDAADSGDFQVGIRLAHELGWPVVNGANTAEVKDDRVVAVVNGPDGHETYDVPLPAVVTVLEGGVEPKYPSVPGRMKAKRVTIEQREPRAELIGPSRVRLRLPEPPPSQVQILGHRPGRGGRRRRPAGDAGGGEPMTLVLVEQTSAGDAGRRLRRGAHLRPRPRRGPSRAPMVVVGEPSAGAPEGAGRRTACARSTR